jgi:hypothetical protein
MFQLASRHPSGQELPTCAFGTVGILEKTGMALRNKDLDGSSECREERPVQPGQTPTEQRMDWRGEGGFTIIELMAVVLIMGTFGNRRGNQPQRLHAHHEGGRRQDDGGGRRSRRRGGHRPGPSAANPIDNIAPASVSTYENKVTFSVYCSTPGQGGVAPTASAASATSL